MTEQLIAGLEPKMYASLWGDETCRGGLFYNYSSEKIEKDIEWYLKFLLAIDDTMVDVCANEEEYEKDDLLNLAKLRVWVLLEFRSLK